MHVNSNFIYNQNQVLGTIPLFGKDSRDFESDYLFDGVVTGPPIIFTIMMVKSFSYFVTVVLCSHTRSTTHQVEEGSFSLGCAAAG